MKVLRMADLGLAGKRVFIRADLNVPQDDDGRITDDTRIRASAPGIRMALDKGAAVMVTSHLGRPKEGQFSAADSLAPVGERLGELLGRRIRLVRDWVDGVEVSPGEVVLLENCRFNVGEKKNDEGLSRKMAALCDVYVNDAFGTAHRAHASTEGVAHHVKTAVAGLLMEKELRYLGMALDGKERRPFMGSVDQIVDDIAHRPWPLPAGPMCTIFLPSACSRGSARRKASSSPPHMMASVAFFAPSTPPLTGQSRKLPPAVPMRRAAVRAVSAETVEQSTTTAPACSDGPIASTTASRSASAATQVTTASHEDASSAGEANERQPVSPAKMSALDAVLFQTPARRPARCRLRAMCCPMAPRPMNPAFMAGSIVPAARDQLQKSSTSCFARARASVSCLSLRYSRLPSGNSRYRRCDWI